jgi:hypothetical protein
VAWLAQEADKAARKRHQDLQNDSEAYEDEAEDVVTSGGSTSCSTGINRLVEIDSKIGLGRSMKKSTRSSGRVSRFTAHNALASRVIVDRLTPCCLRTAS